jgi:hypothetical protein
MMHRIPPERHSAPDHPVQTPRSPGIRPRDVRDFAEAGLRWMGPNLAPALFVETEIAEPVEIAPTLTARFSPRQCL